MKHQFILTNFDIYWLPLSSEYTFITLFLEPAWYMFGPKLFNLWIGSKLVLLLLHFINNDILLRRVISWLFRNSKCGSCCLFLWPKNYNWTNKGIYETYPFELCFCIYDVSWDIKAESKFWGIDVSSWMVLSDWIACLVLVGSEGNSWDERLFSSSVGTLTTESLKVALKFSGNEFIKF